MWYLGAHLESVTAAVSNATLNREFNERILHTGVFSLSGGTEFVGWLQMRNPGHSHTSPIINALRELVPSSTAWYTNYSPADTEH